MDAGDSIALLALVISLVAVVISVALPLYLRSKATDDEKERARLAAFQVIRQQVALVSRAISRNGSQPFYLLSVHDAMADLTTAVNIEHIAMRPDDYQVLEDIYKVDQLWHALPVPEARLAGVKDLNEYLHKVSVYLSLRVKGEDAAPIPKLPEWPPTV